MSQSNELTAELLEEIVYKDTYWRYVDRQKAPGDYL
jgi:hypothetical protein